MLVLLLAARCRSPWPSSPRSRPWSWPVEYSAMAGGTGSRSLALSFWKGRSFSGRLLPLDGADQRVRQRAAGEDGRVRHGLGAAGDRHVRVAQRDGVGRVGQRLDGGGAGARHGVAPRSLRAGPRRAPPRGRWTGAVSVGMTWPKTTWSISFGIQLRALHQLLDHHPAQVQRGQLREDACPPSRTASAARGRWPPAGGRCVLAAMCASPSCATSDALLTAPDAPRQRWIDSRVNCWAAGRAGRPALATTRAFSAARCPGGARRRGGARRPRGTSPRPGRWAGGCRGPG